jgi:hypothetical protein
MQLLTNVLGSCVEAGLDCMTDLACSGSDALPGIGAAADQCTGHLREAGLSD